MAADFFLKIEGLDGEAKDSTYKNWIDIDSWSFGATQPGTAAAGGGMGAGKVSFQDLHIVKRADVSSPKLLLAVANGKHFSKVQIVVRKAGENPLEYYKIDMTDVMVSSFQVGGTDGDSIPVEQVSFNFSEVKFVYTEQLQSGKSGKTPDMTWNIKTNKGA